MRKGIVRTAAVVMVIVLLSLTAMAGCGNGGDKSKPEVIIGYIGDLTGPAAIAVKDTFNGMRDYFRMVEEKGLIPEVSVKILTYDSRSDRGRIPPGYKWLVGQGADMISTISGDEAMILASSLEADQLPNFSFGSSIKMLGEDWMFSVLPPTFCSGEVVGHRIEETWDGAQPAKVGLVGLAPLSISREPLEALQDWCAAAPNLDFVTAQMAPMGTTTWAAEIDHLKVCDYILDTTIGSSMATFERDLIASGWQGTHFGLMNSFMAYWDLARASIPEADLDGFLADTPYVDWNEDVPFVAEVKEYIEAHMDPQEAAEVMRGVGYIGGWAGGKMVAEAIKLAVAQVGAENLDGAVLRDGFLAVDLTVEGFGNAWKVAGDVNSFLQTLRIMKWDAAAERWVQAFDFYRPPILG